MRYLLALTALTITAPVCATPDKPSPILTTPNAKDVLTYAQPTIARVTHVDLDLTVDFRAQVLRGTAALDILARPDAREIILDDNKLVISRITDATGHRLQYTVGTHDA